MKLRKIFFATTVAVVCSSTNFAYGPTKAVCYAQTVIERLDNKAPCRKINDLRDTENCEKEKFSIDHNYNNNCANFVSACLSAGGIKVKKNNARALRTWLLEKDEQGCPKRAIAVSYSELQEGDVMFWPKGGGQSNDHIVLFAKFSSSTRSLFYANTINRCADRGFTPRSEFFPVDPSDPQLKNPDDPNSKDEYAFIHILRDEEKPAKPLSVSIDSVRNCRNIVTVRLSKETDLSKVKVNVGGPRAGVNLIGSGMGSVWQVSYWGAFTRQLSVEVTVTTEGDCPGTEKQTTFNSILPACVMLFGSGDDNFSSASMNPDLLQCGDCDWTQQGNRGVLVLNWGYMGETMSLVAKNLGLPACLLAVDFNPDEAVKKSRVLLVPSGGFMAADRSETFRARLARFAELGGTVMAFAQSHGREFNALPGGEDISAYGWLEDQECNADGSYFTEHHPIFSVAAKGTLSTTVDGYFRTVPQNARVLLRRAANGMPAMMDYPYGAGHVVATTMFVDWLFVNGQATVEARSVVRDMLAWAQDPSRPIPSTLLNEGDDAAVGTVLEVKNNSGRDADKVRVLWFTPDGQVALDEIINQPVLANGTEYVSLVRSLSELGETKFGIWHTAYELLTHDGELVQWTTFHPSSRIAVMRNTPLYERERGYFVTVSSPHETFYPGQSVPFTVRIENNKAVDVTGGQLGVLGINPMPGPFDPMVTGIEIPAGQVVEVPLSFAVEDSRLHYFLFYPDGNLPETILSLSMSGAAAIGIRDVALSCYDATIESFEVFGENERLITDTIYAGEKIFIRARITNNVGTEFSARLTSQLIGPVPSSLFASKTFVLPAGGSVEVLLEEFIPLDVAVGKWFIVGVLQLPQGSIQEEGRTRRCNQRRSVVRDFDIGPFPVSMSVQLPAPVLASSTETISVTVKNNGDVPIVSGELSTNIIIAGEPVGFTFPLGPGEEKSFVVPFPTHPSASDEFEVIISYNDETRALGKTDIRFRKTLTNSLQGQLHRQKGKVGYGIPYNLAVSYAGHFSYSVIARVGVPSLGYTRDYPVSVQHGINAQFSDIVPVSNTTALGSYAATVDIIDSDSGALLSSTVYNIHVIPVSGSIQTTKNQGSYREGDSLDLRFDITNGGEFLGSIPATFQVNIPSLAFSDTKTFNLLPTEGETFEYSHELPVGLGAGSHPIHSQFTLSNGQVFSSSQFFHILNSNLALDGVSSANFSIGDIISVPITNVGGVNSNFDFTIGMRDEFGQEFMEQGTGLLSPLESRALEFTVPSLRSGAYTVFVRLFDQTLGRAQSLTKAVSLQGVVVDFELTADKSEYIFGESVQADSVVVNSEAELVDGQLNLAVIQNRLTSGKTSTEQPVWLHHRGDAHNTGFQSIPGKEGSLFQLKNKIAQWPLSNIWPGSSAVIGDINNDGMNEIVLWGRNTTDQAALYVLDGYGQIIWSYSFLTTVSQSSFDLGSATPALGDVDGDGYLDVAMFTQARTLTVFNGFDGSILWSYTPPTGASVFNCSSQTSSGCTASWNAYVSPTIIDLDGDGDTEVVLSGLGIVALNSQGGVKYTFSSPTLSNHNKNSPPAFADISGDGNLDIIWTSRDVSGSSLTSRVRAFNLNGTVIWNKTIQSSAQFAPVPIIQDLNNNGSLEIVLRSHDRLEIRSTSTGDIIASKTGLNQMFPFNYPVVVDIDGDGDYEIVDRNASTLVHIYDHNLNTTSLTIPLSSGIPYVIDTNGDGNLEIITRCAVTSTTCAIDLNTGQLLWRFGGVASHSDVMGLSFGDINGDGLLDITEGTYVLTANPSENIIPNFSGNLSPWPMRFGNVLRTSAIESSFDIVTPKTIGTSTFQVGTIVSTPVIGDITGDGTNEIVVYDNRGRVWAISENGEKVLWYYDVVLGGNLPTNSSNTLGVPALGDISENGRNEVIVCGLKNIVALNGLTGLPIWTINFTDQPANVFELEGSVPVVADLEGDGSIEIIVAGRGKLVVINGQDGSIRWMKLSNQLSSSYELNQARLCAVGDINEDGNLEVITASTGLRAFNKDGDTLWTSSGSGQFVTADPFRAPIIADIDGNGTMEIIAIGSELQIRNAATGAVEVSKSSISFPEGGSVSVSNISVKNSMAVAALLNNAENKEIVITYASSSSSTVLILNHQLDMIQRSVISTVDTNVSFSTSPLIADLDGDGMNEIYAFTTTSQRGFLTKINPITGEVVGSMDVASRLASPVAADVDNDGKSDLVIFDTIGTVHIMGTNDENQTEKIETIVYWSDVKALNLTPDEDIVFQDFPTNLKDTGKYYLIGNITTSGGQRIAGKRIPFYMFGNEVGVTIDTDAETYKVDDAVTVSGKILNFSDANLNNAQFKVTRIVNATAERQEVYSDTISLASGASVDYLFSITAAEAESYTLLAQALSGDVELAPSTHSFDVETVTIKLSFDIPTVVGNQPFEGRLFISNESSFTLNLQAQIEPIGTTQAMALQPHQTTVLVIEDQIFSNRTYTAIVTGDIAAQNEAQVLYGLDAVISVDVNSHYLIGNIPIEYTVTNQGILEDVIPVSVKIINDAGVEVFTLEHTHFLSPQANISSVFEMSGLEQGTYQVELVARNSIATENFTIEPSSIGDLSIFTDEFYLAGGATIEYSLNNIGHFTSQYELIFELYQDGSLISERSQSLTLDAEQVSAGSEIYDLAAGNYTLKIYSQDGGVPEHSAFFTVIPARSMSIQVVPGQVAAGVFPITVTVTNEGSEIYNGVLEIQGAIGNATAFVEIEPQQSRLVDLALQVGQVFSGTYSVSATLENLDGTIDASTEFQVTVRPAQFKVIDLPVGFEVQAGEKRSLRFVIQNTGDVFGEGAFELDMFDIGRHEIPVAIASGESMEITFDAFFSFGFGSKFYDVPYQVVNYATNAVDDSGQFRYKYHGLNIQVQSALDKGAYRDGDTAILTLTIENTLPDVAVDMFARVQFEDFDERRDFVLNDAHVMGFTIPVSFPCNKLFYGIYFADGTSINLNTTYIYQANDIINIMTDKQVYLPGETVHVDVVANVPGDFNLVIFGETYSSTGSSSFSANVPLEFPKGTYDIWYGFQPEAGEFIFNSHPIDVEGTEILFLDVKLDKTRYSNLDTMTVRYVIQSNVDKNTTLKAHILTPSGTQIDLNDHPVTLTATSLSLPIFTYSFESVELGPHYFVTTLQDEGGESIVTGGVVFDVGDFTLLGVSTDKEVYSLNTEPIIVNSLIQGHGMGELAVFLDDQQIAVSTIQINGVQTEQVSISTLQDPGEHEIRAELTSGSLRSSRTTRFIYGADLPDLVPTVFVNGLNQQNRSLSLGIVVFNNGRLPSSTVDVHVYSGDPDNGGIFIGSATVSEIDGLSSASTTFSWAVTGQAGLHSVFVVVDPANTVTEFREDNNIASITVGVPHLLVAISTDKLQYEAYNIVRASVRLFNNSTSTLPPLAFEAIFANADQTLSQQQGISSTLNPLAENVVGIDFDTQYFAPGTYIATVVLSHEERSYFEQTLFHVLPTINFTGTMQMTPDLIFADLDQQISVDYMIESRSNVPTESGQIRVEIVNQENQATAFDDMSAFNLPVNSSLEGILDLTVNIPQGDYTVNLYAEDIFIDSADLQVIPAVKVTKRFNDGPRVLALLNVSDPMGTVSAQEVENQLVSFVTSSLQAANIQYTVVNSDTAFVENLRSDEFNAFVIASDQNLTNDHFGKEVREAVFGGNRLLTIQWKPFDIPWVLGDTLGVETKGAIPSVNAMEVTDSDFTVSSVFTLNESATRITAKPDVQVIGRFVVTSGNAKSPVTTYHPAITSRTFGLGRGVYFAFNLGVAQNSPNYAGFQQFLVGALVVDPLDYTVTPQPERALPVEIEVESLSPSTTLNVKLSETIQPQVSLTTVFGTPASTDPLVWNLELQPLEHRTLGYVASTGASGSYLATTDVEVNDIPFETVEMDFIIHETVFQALTSTIADIEALTVSAGLETAKKNIALQELNAIASRSWLTKDAFQANILDALQAIDALREITSVDTAPIILKLHHQLRAWERQWTLVE